MVLAGFALMGFALQAQDQDRDRDQDQIRDHILYEDGVVYQVRDQDRDQLRDRIVLNDGTVVNPDGSYQDRTGKRLRLQDGSCLDMEGNVYSNQNQFRRQVESRLQAGAQEHLVYQNGQMYRFRNNEQEQVQEQVRLGNGIVVNPDGTYQNRNGKQLRLRDGECLDMEGKKYMSQQRFRERTAAQLRERSERRVGQAERGGAQQQMREKGRKEGGQRKKGS